MGKPKYRPMPRVTTPRLFRCPMCNETVDVPYAKSYGHRCPRTWTVVRLERIIEIAEAEIQAVAHVHDPAVKVFVGAGPMPFTRAQVEDGMAMRVATDIAMAKVGAKIDRFLEGRRC